jgi:hypothetical protein
MDRLAEINEQLQKLNKERQDLLNNETSRIKKAIVSLRWVKHCSGKLSINSYGGPGLPTYKIYVLGEKVLRLPANFGWLKVMGNNNMSHYNMLYGMESDTGYHYFHTNSSSMVTKFLRIVKFKSFNFNEKHYKVLKAAKDRKLISEEE